MADFTLTQAASLLYELRAPMVAIYPTRNFLLAAWSGVGQDGAPGRITPLDNREAFSGSNVRVPIDVQMMEGGGWVAEGGTVNVPIAPTFTKASVTLKKFVQPFGISLEVMEDSQANSTADALALSLDKAQKALADRVNMAMNGDGTGLLGTVSSHSNLVSTMAAGTDWDKFYVGQIVDVLTRADGTDAGQGKRRRISAISITNSTITFDTASQASDGGSGNITASSASGIYVPGSYGNVLSGGIEAAAASSGTFETVDLSSYPQFKAVDGRAGDTTTKPFSDSMVDLGVTLGQRAGDGMWDFGVGDPNSINVYKNSKTSLVRYNVPTGTVAGRFSGVVIDAGDQSITLVPERKHKPGSIKLLLKSAATLYGRKKGPDFDDITGSQFKQLDRRTSYEVWLIDRLEWGWHSPNNMTYFNNLSTQATAG